MERELLKEFNTILQTVLGDNMGFSTTMRTLNNFNAKHQSVDDDDDVSDEGCSPWTGPHTSLSACSSATPSV